MAEFSAIADDLRTEILSYYAAQGSRLEGEAGRNTLETNSGFVPRRARPLIEMLRVRGQYPTMEGLSLADLGCGFGALSAYFASLGSDVVGLDVNGSRLEVARLVCADHGLSARFQQAPMQDLPLPDAAVDVAIMNNSLCYLVDRAQRASAIAEARRVLRPGGHLLIRNPNRWALVEPFTSLPLLAVLPGQLPRRVAGLAGRSRSEVRLVSIPAALRELRAAGFEQASEVPVPGRSRPLPVRLVSRYQHLIARRPG